MLETYIKPSFTGAMFHSDSHDILPQTAVTEHTTFALYTVQMTQKTALRSNVECLIHNNPQ